MVEQPIQISPLVLCPQGIQLVRPIQKVQERGKVGMVGTKSGPKCGPASMRFARIAFLSRLRFVPPACGFYRGNQFGAEGQLV